ncbi:recombinase A [compost metagenome]
MAVDQNIVGKSGSWFSYGSDKIGQGREGAKEYLRQNPEVCDEIEAAVRAKLLAHLGEAPAPALN